MFQLEVIAEGVRLWLRHLTGESLHHGLDVLYLGHQDIRTFGQLGHSLAWAGVAREYDRAARRVEAIGVGPVLAVGGGGGRLMKMRILGRRHPDAVVGVHQAVMVDVMGLEPAFRVKYWH